MAVHLSLYAIAHLYKTKDGKYFGEHKWENPPQKPTQSFNEDSKNLENTKLLTPSISEKNDEKSKRHVLATFVTKVKWMLGIK